MKSATEKYLPGVDGLRAIAVMAVILFHAGIPGLSGGFVGVDVFFVISGFLITRLISDEVRDHSNFDFPRFYARRARRLFPALFFIFVCSFIFAFLLFDPEQFREFGAELLYSMVSISNFHFWAQSGYFDTGANLKPLLHTWSLSVEEQFYLIWPLVLVCFLRWTGKVGVLFLLAVSFVISLFANFVFQDGQSSVLWHLSPMVAEWMKDGPSSIFYLTPFRIFEFAIGAILVWLPRPKWKLAKEVMMMLGLIFIAYAIHCFNDKTVFPSFHALIPCIGAALIIMSVDGPVSAFVVTNPISVFIGRISYSIYLVHWPLMVFYRYWRAEPISLVEEWALVAISLVLSYLIFRFIESPFRHSQNKTKQWSAPAVGFICLLLIIVGIVPAASVWTNGGWPWRIDSKSLAIGANTVEINDIVGRLGCSISCEFGNTNGPKVLIVGDSHSDQYTKALKQIGGEKYHFYQAYGPSCFFGKTMESWPNDSLGPQCKLANEKLHEWLNTIHFDAIIVAQRWPGYKSILTRGPEHIEIQDLNALFPAMLRDISSLYKDYSGRIVFVGHAPNTNTSCYRRPQYLPIHCPPVPKFEHEQFVTAYKKFEKETNLNVKLVNPIDTICPNNGDCMTEDKRHNMLYSDPIHLSIYGALLVVPNILDAVKGG